MTDVVLPLLTASSMVLSALAITLVLGLTLRIQRLEKQIGTNPTIVDPTLPVGTAVRIEDLPAPETRTSLAQLKRASIWFFVAAACKPCGELIRNLNLRRKPDGVPIIVVVPGVEDERLLKTDARFTAEWLVDAGGEIRNAFGVRATPIGLILRDGTIADTELGSGADRLVEPPHGGNQA